MKVLAPIYKKSNSTLFKCMFGDIPAEAKRDTYRDLIKKLMWTSLIITINNFLQIIRSAYQFLSSICAHHLEFRRPRMERAVAVFVINHDNPLDIIGYRRSTGARLARSADSAKACGLGGHGKLCGGVCRSS